MQLPLLDGDKVFPCVLEDVFSYGTRGSCLSFLRKDARVWAQLVVSAAADARIVGV